MATLAEIRANPATYLGEGSADDHELFVIAVEVLTSTGIPEDEAIDLVWNDGDWYPGVVTVLVGIRIVKALMSTGISEDEAISMVRWLLSSTFESRRR